MSSSLTADILKILKDCTGQTVVVTAGNTFRSDDGVGPYISSQLSDTFGLRIVEAGQNPENIVDEVIALKPDAIIVIDAAHFEGYPGEVRVIPEDLIPSTSLSTHMIPLNVVIRLIVEDNPVTVHYLGVQILSAELGEGLSGEIKASADELITVFQSFSDNKK